MSSILQDIADKAKVIKDKGYIEKVALDEILHDIKRLQRKTRKIEKKWIRSNDEYGFYFYHGTRNLGLFLGKIIKRFTNKRNKLQTALDVLAIIPAAKKILEMTDGKAYAGTEGEILARLLCLSDAGADANLLETEKEIQKKLTKMDQSLLEEIFNELIKELAIQEEYTEIPITESEECDLKIDKAS